MKIIPNIKLDFNKIANNLISIFIISIILVFIFIINKLDNLESELLEQKNQTTKIVNIIEHEFIDLTTTLRYWTEGIGQMPDPVEISEENFILNKILKSNRTLQEK